eukprot:354323-Chlamydomonas_euryale.AAC.1
MGAERVFFSCDRTAARLSGTWQLLWVDPSPAAPTLDLSLTAPAPVPSSYSRYVRRRRCAVI